MSGFKNEWTEVCFAFHMLHVRKSTTDIDDQTSILEATKLKHTEDRDRSGLKNKQLTTKQGIVFKRACEYF